MKKVCNLYVTYTYHRIQVFVTMYIIVIREFRVDLLKIVEEIKWQNLEDFR